MLNFVSGPKDFWAGLIYLVLGASFAIVAAGYPMGTAVRMGPGYFPAVLGALLALFGLLSIIRGVRTRGEAIEKFAWRPVLFISLSIVLFALLLQGAGFIIALAALLLVAPAAGPSFRYSLSGVVAAIALIVFCGAIFVEALGLPLPLLGTWFGG